MNLFDHSVYVGIVGSRRRDTDHDYGCVLGVFLREIKLRGWLITTVTIVSGGCPLGADRFAEIIADAYGVARIIHRPDKTTFLYAPEPHRSTQQNYARNSLIARDSQDLLIACVAADRRGGTEDTISKYRRIHKREPVLV